MLELLYYHLGYKKKQTNKQTNKLEHYYFNWKFLCFLMIFDVFNGPYLLRARSQITVVGVTGRTPGWPGALKLPGSAV